MSNLVHDSARRRRRCHLLRGGGGGALVARYPSPPQLQLPGQVRHQVALKNLIESTDYRAG